ncbi:MAG: mechanosensitive ion channel [Streptosporangiales bacterium]|nr:mechanosensitive ion channel [Streptosporangiales bacterium]
MSLSVLSATDVLPSGPQTVQRAVDGWPTACSKDPGVWCDVIVGITGNARLAGFADTFLAGPLNLLGRVALILGIALFARAMLHRLTNRLTRRAAQATMPDRLRARGRNAGRPNGSAVLREERRRQRANTLGSVLRSTASVITLGIALLMIIGELGMNLAPLLASAGVVGVAIGFGAQAVVKDFITGMFMLMEDQYGVGDVITVGTTKGTVEAVSLRVTRLRDVNGVVWYVRNGEITQVGNEAQGWSRAILDVPIAYDEDAHRVRRIIERAAAEMRTEEDWHDVLIEDPEVWGVEALSSASVVMRVVVKTVPLRQSDAARELRARLKDAFQRENVAVSE